MNNYDLKLGIEKLKFDPTRIQQMALDKLEQYKNGELKVVDPTNPFVYLMEVSSMTASTSILHNEITSRKMYPKLAMNQNDIYRHMSDVDYIDRFASPAQGRFKFIFDYNELIRNMIYVGDTKVKKIVIPRGTTVIINEIHFTLLYPIEIRQLPHGGIQVVYDVSKENPLMDIESNLIQHEITQTEENTLIIIPVTIKQVKQRIINATALNITGFKQDYNMGKNLEFVHFRAYGRLTDGSWKEYKSTHSDIVYDPREVTIKLNSYNSGIGVEIPQIYFTSNMVSKNIRFELYSCLGEINFDLSAYPYQSYRIIFGGELDTLEESDYSANLSKLAIKYVFGEGMITGGKSAIPFDVLRNNVIENATFTKIPITEAQLRQSLNQNGMDLIKSIDDVTKRVFIASRFLETNQYSKTFSPINATINTVKSSFLDLVELNSVADNNERLTIRPETLWEVRDGLTVPVSDAKLNSLMNMPIDLLVSEVNQNRFLYTPFYYVLDTTGNNFTTRVYHLDQPEITSKKFVADNPSLFLEVYTNTYTIEKTNYGYRLLIKVKSGDAYKALDDDNVYCQIRYLPYGKNSPGAFMNGEIITKGDDNERYWEFKITTNYDIDEEDNIIFNSFSMFNDEKRKYPCSILNKIDVYHIVRNYKSEGMKKSDLDKEIGIFLVEKDSITISKETLNIKFGECLNPVYNKIRQGLWINARTVAGSESFKTYQEDVYWTWENDVYEIDELTGTWKYTLKDGLPIYTYKHRKGDMVLTEDGKPVIKYFKGSVITDGQNNPIVISGRPTLRHWDMLFLEGVYYFANSDSDVLYKESIPNQILGYINTRLRPIYKNLHENTALYLFPKKSIGNIEVIVDNGLNKIIDSNNSFNVKVYMTRAGHLNNDLKEVLAKKIKETIIKILNKPTVSISELYDVLADDIREDVMGFEIEEFGPLKNIPVFTPINDSIKSVVRKKIVYLPEGRLQVYEDINIEFVNHQGS